MKHVKHMFLTLLFVSMTMCMFQNCSQKKELIFNSNNVRNANQSTAEILYFIEKEEVSKDFLDRINPTNIQSVNVVKTAEEIVRFTNKKVAGIIIIKLKK
ncbi:MAG: hypothetical protein P8Q33_06780 [Polaribacter sp.]|nr:hypothetical protein [Polaribacter sp.]